MSHAALMSIVTSAPAFTGTEIRRSTGCGNPTGPARATPSPTGSSMQSEGRHENRAGVQILQQPVGFALREYGDAIRTYRQLLIEIVTAS
jgi:hypothetical protein